MSEIWCGASAHPLKRMTPDCFTLGSGKSSAPVKSSCANRDGAASATVATIRQRLTHLHITPTSNPELTLPVLCDRPGETPIRYGFGRVYTKQGDFFKYRCDNGFGRCPRRRRPHRPHHPPHAPP